MANNKILKYERWKLWLSVTQADYKSGYVSLYKFWEHNIKPKFECSYASFYEAFQNRNNIENLIKQEQERLKKREFKNNGKSLFD